VLLSWAGRTDTNRGKQTGAAHAEFTCADFESTLFFLSFPFLD
jgi:hypothetical protein